MKLLLGESDRLSPRSVWRDLESMSCGLFDGFPLGLTEPVGTWAPKVDVDETPDAFVLAADMPGLSKDDIDISVFENVVTLKGERKEGRESEAAGWRRHERRFGRFERSFEVPGGFDTEKIDAKFKDGVLRITLPKLQKDKPKQIEVKFN